MSGGSGAGNSALRVPHSAFVWLHCAWKTGYTVTLLSINNLAGYKSVTPQLHGYIVVTQQLTIQIGNKSATNRQPAVTFSPKNPN